MPNDVPRQRVLIIDDDLGPRESMRMLLKEEFEVRCADSVERGLELFRACQPDVVVLDIRMPGQNGLEGLRRIRELDPHVSVVMLTGFAALETAQEALRLGATDYLRKPFETREMLENVRRCARRTQVHRRRAEAARSLRALNQRLMAELAEMERLATLGQASAELLHDLRNPLTIVLGYVELLAQQLEQVKDELGVRYDEAARCIEVIEKNIRRCQELAKLWRADGGSRVATEAVAVVDLMEDVRGSAEVLAASSRAALHWDVRAGQALLWASRAQLLRAVLNVVANACQAVEEKGGNVWISTQATDREVIIQVRDDGCGIAPENLQRIFEPYFTTKPNGQGTGLGLAITKRVVEDYRGRVEVESEPGRGTTVVLRLPRFDGPSAEP